jgi:transposase
MEEHREDAARRAARRLVVIATASACTVTACAPGFATAPMAHAPEIADGQTRCKIAASHENPLVTEWPAPEKANLEARLREGSIVVAYSGCALKMLPRCRVKGAYQWRRTTTATDTIEIHNADELYAKMPLGATTLEGELQRSGRLAVQTTVSGQFKLEALDLASFPRDADCEGATHVIGALSVGTFTLRSGGSAKVSAQGSVGAVHAGGSSSSDETVMREAGTPTKCDQGSDSAPNPECASPIQMFLQPLPASIVDRGPAGTVKAKFLPVRPRETWDVVVGDRKICTTPCERWVDPAMPYSLKYDPGTFSKNEFVELPDLRPFAFHERIEVRPTPRNSAEQVGGVLMTTFGGLGVVTGTVLSLVGAGQSDKTLRNAGLITLGSGLVLLVPGIWLIVDSKGSVSVTPMPAQSRWQGGDKP